MQQLTDASNQVNEYGGDVVFFEAEAPITIVKNYGYLHFGSIYHTLEFARILARLVQLEPTRMVEKLDDLLVFVIAQIMSD